MKKYTKDEYFKTACYELLEAECWRKNEKLPYNYLNLPVNIRRIDGELFQQIEETYFANEFVNSEIRCLMTAQLACEKAGF